MYKLYNTTYSAVSLYRLSVVTIFYLVLSGCKKIEILLYGLLGKNCFAVPVLFLARTHPTSVADPGFGQGGASSGPPDLADLAEQSRVSKASISRHGVWGPP